MPFNMKQYESMRAMTDRTDYLQTLLDKDDLEQDLLPEIARSPLSEEVIFNLITPYYFKAKEGQQIDEHIVFALSTLSTERMNELKSHFPKRSIGRDTPGKMEYDTTMQSLNDLLRMLGRK
jgi:hypothetical protein